MKILCALFLFLFGNFQVSAKLFSIEVKVPLLGQEPPPGSLWPLPQFINGTSPKLLYLNQNRFKITTNMKIDCDLIEKNKAFYQNILFPPKEFGNDMTNANNLLTELNIEIGAPNSCPGYPDSKMDESYELNISNGIAQVKCASVWGALRGMETFSQLTFIDNNNQLAINDSTYINDFPRFSYRGVMLDTARHFIPIPILKKQLDAMAYNKFNVFHWHIVDDQSFPFESLKYPNLTTNGRYTKAHVYTQSDVRDLINHARLRGIRVIPEFDTPGHVNALGLTFPQFITVCWKDGKPFQAIFQKQGKAEIFNPTIDELYPFLKDILSEIKSVFVDEYIHLGNDEVYYECWKSNPNITEWMKKMNFTEYNQLEAFYSNKILDITKQLNKKSTVWQDVYDNGVRPDKSTSIQIWKDTSTLDDQQPWQEYLFNITRDGYQAILSSPWYINFVSYGYQEWYKYYQIDPAKNFQGTKEQEKLIIGGETCLWAEYVDGTNIASRLWPRASAIAERLWSPARANDPEEAKYRLDEHRCRMLRRGIPATPVLNGYCGDYEYGMNKNRVYESSFNYGWPILDSSLSNSSKINRFNNIFMIICLFLYKIFN